MITQNLNFKFEGVLAIPVSHCAPSVPTATTIKARPEPEDHDGWMIQESFRV